MEKEKSKIKKYIISFLVMLVIVVLPAGSWYYLSTGLQYRKDALVELESKGPFILKYSDTEMKPLLEKFTTIVVENSYVETQESFIQELLGQYGKSVTFQVMAIRSEADSSYVQVDSSGLYKQLFIKESLPSDIAQYSIVDTSGLLRGTYQTDNASMRKLIEHTAIILPRLKEIDRKTSR